MKKTLLPIISTILLLTACSGLSPDAIMKDSTPKEVEVLPPEEPSEEAAAHEDSGVIAIPDPEEEGVSAEAEDVITVEPEAEPEEEEPEEEDANSFEGYVLSEEDVSENGVYCMPVKNEGEVVIDFAGDINFDDRYANMNALRSRAGGIHDSIDASLIQRTNEADIFMINNEFPYSNRGTPTPGKKFTFRAKPETVGFMHDLGADIVSLANNHAYDHGPDALLDTFDTLNEAGIPYVGAGRNIEEAMKPVYFIAGGMKISFVSATQIERSLPPDTKEATETEPGVLRTLDPEKFLSVIREAKKNSDFCIAYVHWGSENVNEYEAAQAELAKAYADAGADLIMGDHPHVLQGIEYIGDVPVFYSLGNYWFNSKTLDNCLVEAVLQDKKIKSLQFIPCMQYSCATHEVQQGSGDFERILGNMRDWSTDNVNIAADGFITGR